MADTYGSNDPIMYMTPNELSELVTALGQADGALSVLLVSDDIVMKLRYQTELIGERIRRGMPEV